MNSHRSIAVTLLQKKKKDKKLPIPHLFEENLYVVFRILIYKNTEKWAAK
jgi:hypothetical protein